MFSKWRITFKVTDVFVARISETVGFAGLQKCGGMRRGSEGVARPT